MIKLFFSILILGLQSAFAQDTIVMIKHRGTYNILNNYCVNAYYPLNGRIRYYSKINEKGASGMNITKNDSSILKYMGKLCEDVWLTEINMSAYPSNEFRRFKMQDTISAQWIKKSEWEYEEGIYTNGLHFAFGDLFYLKPNKDRPEYFWGNIL